MKIKILGKDTGLGNCIQFIPQISWLKEQGIDVYSDRKEYEDLGICRYSTKSTIFNIAVFGYDWKKYIKALFSCMGLIVGFKYRIKKIPIGLGLIRSIKFDYNKSEMSNNNDLIRSLFKNFKDQEYPKINRGFIKNRIVIGMSPKKIKYINDINVIDLIDSLEDLGYEVITVDKCYRNYINTPTIIDLYNVLSSAEYYIGADTGVGHLADYIGIPSIKIFNGTNIQKNKGGAKVVSVKNNEFDINEIINKLK